MNLYVYSKPHQSFIFTGLDANSTFIYKKTHSLSYNSFIVKDFFLIDCFLFILM